MTTLAACGAESAPLRLGHPRLYFTAAELPRLRALRTQGVHARIWENLRRSARWCLTQTPRKDWIAPVAPDPIYLNLYDRFYAMMRDMAIMEHLAFAYAYSGEAQYSDAGRTWTIQCCRIWSHEADGAPDASKAYAVMRLLKGVAVSYDMLYDRLSDEERREVRDTLLSIGRKYYQWYLANPGMAGPSQDKHHGSVETSSFGVAALALLGEAPEANDWLDLMIRKHTDYLLPHALTASGTQEQTSNFWASTMHYRLFFLDPLRRVTGRDLFGQYARFMPGEIALAAVVAGTRCDYDEDNQSVLFGPSYGQLDYWSPALLYLAREYRRPLYQRLALWDTKLGALQETRYITPNGEQLLFALGGYAYAWYDPSVKPWSEANAPRSFLFADVNEAYARASYSPGGIVAGMRKGCVIVHAGGRPVLVDLYRTHQEPSPVPDLSLADDGAAAAIRCSGAVDSGFAEQTVTLTRPGTVTIRRQTSAHSQWWCGGSPAREGNTLMWPDGTRLTVTRGSIASFEPEGYHDEKIVGLGLLKCVDPHPCVYPLVTAAPTDGVLELQVSAGR